MSFLSHALEWLRAGLFGPRTPDRHCRTAAHVAPPPAAGNWPAPDVLGIRLVVARGHRRDRHAPPARAPRPQARAPWEAPGALVRPYVAHLGDVPRTARTGVPADPWGVAR